MNPNTDEKQTRLRRRLKSSGKKKINAGFRVWLDFGNNSIWNSICHLDFQFSVFSAVSSCLFSPSSAHLKMKILLCMVLALAVATAAIAGPCGALTYSTNGKSADIYNLDALTNMYVFCLF